MREGQYSQHSARTLRRMPPSCQAETRDRIYDHATGMISTTSDCTIHNNGRCSPRENVLFGHVFRLQASVPPTLSRNDIDTSDRVPALHEVHE